MDRTSSLGIASPTLINAQVTVTPGAGPDQYDVTCDPELMVFTTPGIANFQIVSAPEDVIFSIDVTEDPPNSDQLSAPTLSTNGNMLTLNNVCTEKKTITLTLYAVHRQDPSVRIDIDPQIHNDPQPR